MKPRTKPPKKPYAGTPLENWTDDDFNELWCLLYHGSIGGVNYNANRATVIRHYCNVPEQKKFEFMLGKRNHSKEEI